MTQWICRTLVAALVAATASGCTLYFGDDTADDCQFGFGAEAPGGQRNPQTNQCDFFGGGGGGCGANGDDDIRADSEAPAPNDWAECFTECEGLDELTCFTADRCRATYTQCFPGEDCFRRFSGCVGIAPSGPASGEACQGLDAYGCSRHNDCVATYGTTDLPNDGYSGTGVFVGCDAEPSTQGCFSDSDCGPGTECTVDHGGECSSPPGGGCGADADCDQACFGHCVPSGGMCGAVDCGPGFHCEEVCPDTGSSDQQEVPTDPGQCQVTCVPDQNFCPIECPPNSQCVEACPPCAYPGDPSCTDSCHYECQPIGTGVCENFDCGDDSHCEEQCRSTAPFPGDPGETVCEPFCVPNGPDVCDATMCGAGEHCELQCVPSVPTDPAGPMSGCTATCVPDEGLGCEATDCGPGTHCIETCLAIACPGTGPMGCPDVCRSECVPDGPGECSGDVLCDAIPPPCPFGTVPGVENGCWTGYCIAADQCDEPPVLPCEEEQSELSCSARTECTPVFTGVCWPNPDGTYNCTDTQFVRCESRLMPLPG